jgi:hypothetical protein
MSNTQTPNSVKVRRIREARLVVHTASESYTKSFFGTNREALAQALDCVLCMERTFRPGSFQVSSLTISTFYTGIVGI